MSRKAKTLPSIFDTENLGDLPDSVRKSLDPSEGKVLRPYSMAILELFKLAEKSGVSKLTTNQVCVGFNRSNFGLGIKTRKEIASKLNSLSTVGYWGSGHIAKIKSVGTATWELNSVGRGIVS